MVSTISASSTGLSLNRIAAPSATAAASRCTRKLGWVRTTVRSPSKAKPNERSTRKGVGTWAAPPYGAPALAVRGGLAGEAMWGERFLFALAHDAALVFGLVVVAEDVQ